MPLTRRLFLAASTLTVAGCATSPVVNGQPALAPSEPPPTQDPLVGAAAAEVSALKAVLDALSTQAGYQYQPWAVAAAAQCDAHLTRLRVPDPLSPEPQEPFPAPTPTPSVAGPVLDDTLTAQVGASVAALEDAAAGADEADLRLLLASAAAATVGLRNTAVAPVAGTATPHRMQPTTLAASLPITLGHAWALIYGLGVGIGRLPRKDPLREALGARLASAKVLRNELRAALEGEPIDQPAAFELPTPMDSVASIKEGWAVLEGNLLDGYARLVAADALPLWRERMRSQVPVVQQSGGTIEFWTGWVS